MVLFGTIVNTVLVIIGAIIGRFLFGIPERMKETVMYGIGLAVIVIGVQMSLEGTETLIVIASIVIGGVIGEWLDLDHGVNRLGKWIERKLSAGKETEGPSISQGFVTSTLIFIVGSMGIIGAIDGGIRNQHDVLIMKGVIDGFAAIVLSSTLGIGVLFGAFPILIYQGTIALLSTQISKYIPDDLLSFFISEMTATGGLMIIGVGLNLIGLTKIRVANLVPGIGVVAVIVTILYYI